MKTLPFCVYLDQKLALTFPDKCVTLIRPFLMREIYRSQKVCPALGPFLHWEKAVKKRKPESNYLS